jgi:hypothetical protein
MSPQFIRQTRNNREMIPDYEIIIEDEIITPEDEVVTKKI